MAFPMRRIGLEEVVVRYARCGFRDALGQLLVRGSLGR